jgi:hypothetical protein
MCFFFPYLEAAWERIFAGLAAGAAKVERAIFR